MTDREKLIELLITADDYEERVCLGNSCNTCQYTGINCSYKAKADHLIANGVTFATDTNVGDKMTPTDKDTNVLTNADRIRAMSDEELAYVLAEHECNVAFEVCKSFGLPSVEYDFEESLNELLCFLKQPSEVEHE